MLHQNESPTKRKCSAQMILEDGVMKHDNQNSRIEQLYLCLSESALKL